MIDGCTNENKKMIFKIHYEFEGPLFKTNYVDIMNQGYTMEINYYNLEDLKKDLDDRLIDDLVRDPRLKKLFLILHNPNWVEPEKRNPPVFITKSSEEIK